MKRFLSVILVIIAVFVGVGLAKAAVNFAAGSVTGTNTSSTSRSAEPTYMGVTKDDYLEVVGNNGQDTAAICAYTYLIDTYGLEATYKMDRRADKDINDVDPAIYEAIDRCL